MSLDIKANSSTGEYYNRLGFLNQVRCMCQKIIIKVFINSLAAK